MALRGRAPHRTGFSAAAGPGRKKKMGSREGTLTKKEIKGVNGFPGSSRGQPLRKPAKSKGDVVQSSKERGFPKENSLRGERL